MLRDESIVFALKNANTSSTMHLLMYDDMPPVFAMFDFVPGADDCLKAAGEFIRNVTVDGKEIPNKSLLRVAVDGQRRPLEEGVVVGWEDRVGKLGGGHEILAQLL
jgi:hypothetical protein